MSGRIVIPKHIDALDGLRAIAILLVLLVHCGLCYIVNSTPRVSIWQDIVVNGRSGVDLFFVLSGFLITGILLDTRDRNDYFPRFYWRRALRIWPVYYAFIFAALLIHPRVFSGVGFRSFALYYRNFLPVHPFADLYFGQFWSLCVEEQFYLVWPVIVFFLPGRLRLPLIGTLMVTAMLLRFALLHHGMTEYMVYRLPFCRMDSLAAGAGIAVLIREPISSRVAASDFLGRDCDCGRNPDICWTRWMGAKRSEILYGRNHGLCIVPWRDCRAVCDGGSAECRVICSEREVFPCDCDAQLCNVFVSSGAAAFVCCFLPPYSGLSAAEVDGNWRIPGDCGDGVWIGMAFVEIL